MSFSVVLDANVLYPASLRDSLLRFASRDFFIPVCSARILDEAQRNLIADGRLAPDNAATLRQKMQEVFEDAWVEDTAIAHLESSMSNDPKDRHVLAAAVVSEAQTIVTLNVKDFRAASVEPYGIQVQHPDEFLLGLFGLNPDLAVSIIRDQAAALKRPPLTAAEVLDRLAVAGVPEFSAAVRAQLA